MTDFTLPELGENVTSGDVLRVLVKPGDVVAKDQTVLELETDKATIEVPSSVAGRVKDVKVKAGDTVKVGQAILSLEEGGAAAPAGKAPAQKPEAKAGAQEEPAKPGQKGSAEKEESNPEPDVEPQTARSGGNGKAGRAGTRGDVPATQDGRRRWSAFAGPAQPASATSSTSRAARGRLRTRPSATSRWRPRRRRCAAWRASSASKSIRSPAPGPRDASRLTM